MLLVAHLVADRASARTASGARWSGCPSSVGVTGMLVLRLRHLLHRGRRLRGRAALALLRRRRAGAVRRRDAARPRRRPRAGGPHGGARRALVTVDVALFATVVALARRARWLEPVDRRARPGRGRSCATTYHPTQVLLRGVVDELLFGKRPDPLGAASRVAGRIGDDPVMALRAIREALVLPYAALRRSAATTWWSRARETTHTRTLPLDGATASWSSGCRPGDLSLSAGDEQVLRLVGAAAGPDAAGPGAGRGPARVARPRSRRSRRSAAGCGATSTTGSGPGCPGSPSPPTRRAT